MEGEAKINRNASIFKAYKAMAIYNLPPYVTIMTKELLRPDGIYSIGSGQMHCYPFEIEVDGQSRVPLVQMGQRQSFSIRAWVSKDPNGSELFMRFHPGTGGIAHIFYDKNMEVPPKPAMSALKKNKFSGIPYRSMDILIPLMPGKYFYNVQNLEMAENIYKISFTGLLGITISPEC